MALFFKAKSAASVEEPSETFTRFKRWHVRDEPTPGIDRGIDPHKNLTRSDKRHLRTFAPRAASGVSAQKTTRLRNHDFAADLHATESISVDVLRRALPLRSAGK